ncbi:MAG: Uma2 family endonuclease [Acidobacteriota bacterium]
MPAAAAPEFTGIIARLPPGSSLRMDNVSWDHYEELLADPGESHHKRIFYDQGRMEITATTSVQERRKSLIHNLITTLSDELDVDVESLGSTTYKEEWKAKGAEPDDSFYIQIASAVMGKDENLDLAHDPPPDLVIDVDCSSSSLNRFPIYAGLGVPELWRIYQRLVRIWVLEATATLSLRTAALFRF